MLENYLLKSIFDVVLSKLFFKLTNFLFVILLWCSFVAIVVSLYMYTNDITPVISNYCKLTKFVFILLKTTIPT